MNLYLAGTMSRPYVFNEWTSIWQERMGRPKSSRKKSGGGADYEHLSCRGASSKEWPIGARGGAKILESFYYCRENDWIPKLLPYLGDFLLDSGAFTFIQGTAHVDWDAYTEEYAAWINRYKIEKFFELDIDSIVGLREVERLRKKLEHLTNRQPIPVWHKSRGLDYFQRICQEYRYVAIGGIVTKEIPRDKYEKAFPYFINTAHEAGAKIHCLGYTSFEGVKKYHFDSIDSTAWLYGNRGGYLYLFDPTTGKMGKKEAPGGYRLKSSEAAKWNFNEWIKYQKYAEKYL